MTTDHKIQKINSFWNFKIFQNTPQDFEEKINYIVWRTLQCRWHFCSSGAFFLAIMSVFLRLLSCVLCTCSLCSFGALSITVMIAWKTVFSWSVMAAWSCFLCAPDSARAWWAYPQFPWWSCSCWPCCTVGCSFRCYQCDGVPLET